MIPVTPVARPRTREQVGKVLTVVASVVGPPAAAFSAFAAAITWTGCFIDCADRNPDHELGALLGMLAVLLLLAGPVLAATLVRRWPWVLGAVVAPFLQAALLLFSSNVRL